MQPLGEIRYLSLRDVEKVLPSIDEQMDVVSSALTSLASGTVDMPAKIALHPRFEAFLHAMPAWFRDEDLVGMKWVAGYPGNPASGLVGVTGLIILNDPDSGYARCIMDGSLVTLVRTAAVSGVAFRTFAPKSIHRAAMIGCGMQARAHLRVFLSLTSDFSVVVCDRSAERASEFAEWARTLAGIRSVEIADSVQSALRTADVVFTSVSSRGGSAELIGANDLEPGSLVLAIDWADAVTGNAARGAAMFVVDDRAQFEYIRSLDDGFQFPDYPDPGDTLGEAVLRGRPRDYPRDGYVVVNNLGIGAVDLLLAERVFRAAEAHKVGTLLEW